jgi:hypothetical protein
MEVCVGAHVCVLFVWCEPCVSARVLNALTCLWEC